MDFRLLGVPVHLEPWHLLLVGTEFAFASACVLGVISGLRELPTPPRRVFAVCLLLGFLAYPAAFLPHEYGHALVNLHVFGMHVTGIETTPVGFVTRALETTTPENLTPQVILISSLAGPLAGMLAAVLELLFIRLWKPGNARRILEAVAWTAFFYNAINIAPGYGDGYWILTSLRALYFS